MQKTKSGFTIVELLIVIVIIGILAAITIIAYNGITDRANNTKTVSALEAWVKSLTMYKADIGHWITIGTCLGEGYLYGVSGNDSSGTAQCRQSASGGYKENATFNTAMKPYTGGSLPTPAFVTARVSDTEWRRGLSYTYGGGDGTKVYIFAAFAGQGDCPAVNGVTTIRTVAGSNIYCEYDIGLTTDT